MREARQLITCCNNTCYDNYCFGNVKTYQVATGLPRRDIIQGCLESTPVDVDSGRPTVASPGRGGVCMIPAELLARVPLFAKIPEDERGSLAARAADVRLRTDEWLIQEGQTPGFYPLLKGSLPVHKLIAGRDQRLATYEVGEYFGEVPLLLASPAFASIRALEPSRVMRLDPTDFHDLITHCRVLKGEIMRTMPRRIGIVQQAVVDTPVSEATLIGREHDVASVELRDFLSRNRVSFGWRDLDNSDDIDRLVCDKVLSSPDQAASEFAGVTLPLVVLADRRRLE